MSIAQTPPGQPNEYLLRRYTLAMQHAESQRPTGDPGTFHCGVRAADGTTCGRRRVQAGKAGNRVLMCPTCDQPGSAAPPTALDWPAVDA